MAEDKKPEEAPAEEKKPASKTPKERQEEKRQEKLADVRQQVKDGNLVIRQMTPAERKKFGDPKPRPEKKKR